MVLRRRLLMRIALVALFIAGFILAGSWHREALHRAAAAAGGAEKAAASDSKIALEVIGLLKENYIDEVDVVGLLRAYGETHSIVDMVRTLNDPYTRYLDKSEYAAMKEDMSGKFDGVGVSVGMRDGRLTIIAPLDDSPGQRAGLRPLDRISTIDGKPTKDMELNYAVSLIRGKKGTEVVLGIERDEGSTTRAFEVRIVRDTVRVPRVASNMLDGRIGYVELASFSGETTLEDLTHALDDLGKRGMKALILDLRYNGGGSVPLALEVASIFLPAGRPVVHMVGRSGERVTFHSGPGRKVTLPMVVLVNEASASASEIVAGALQDTKVATIVGTTTFGKGVVMTVYPLSDGSAVVITTHRYLTAGGHSIDKKGVIPDAVVTVPDEPADPSVDPQLDEAVKILNARIQGSKATELAG